jgi:hypothetical protein
LVSEWLAVAGQRFVTVVTPSPEVLARLAEYLTLTWVMKARKDVKPALSEYTRALELSTYLQMTLPRGLYEIVVNSAVAGRTNISARAGSRPAGR